MIVAAMEMGRRAQPLPLRKQHILSTGDAYNMFVADALVQHQEVVSVLLLNAKIAGIDIPCAIYAFSRN